MFPDEVSSSILRKPGVLPTGNDASVQLVYNRGGGEMKLLRTILLVVTVALMTLSVPAQTGGAGKAPSKTTQTKKGTSATSALVDINSASAAELKALPGIGDAYSAKIIAGRPYANKAQLVSKNIIPQSTYDKIRDLIIARQKK